MKPIQRRISKEVRVGSLVLGGNNPIRVQSMTTTDTRDVEATVRQIQQARASRLRDRAGRCLKHGRGQPARRDQKAHSHPLGR
jgi:hypothetical protein